METTVELATASSIVMNGLVPHSICVKAAKALQERLSGRNDWQHNFGLDISAPGAIIGKMFGVLVVSDQQGQLGYLAAFSGKIGGRNHHDGFVPPVFDALTEESFLNNGMKELTRINHAIREMEQSGDRMAVNKLKDSRREHSTALQQRLFDQYHFLNYKGVSRSLTELFNEAGYKNPPSGAGECAGPKLLQFAFLHGLRPIALAEFWWGQSPKSDQWKHKHFYPCCREKCEPILRHMLDGL